jgi:hypothetical protein
MTLRLARGRRLHVRWNSKQRLQTAFERPLPQTGHEIKNQKQAKNKKVDFDDGVRIHLELLPKKMARSEGVEPPTT